MSHLRRLTGTLLATVLAAAPVVAAEPAQAAPAAPAALPTQGMSAEQLNSTFQAYGDAGGHWTGGDSTASVPLPDGRLLWLFSDSFLGTVNPDGSRPRTTPMVNNTMVVQDGSALVSTRHGGSPALPEALVKPTQKGEFFWVADGTVENGSLKVLYNRYRPAGTGNLDFKLTGTALATFTLPALTVSSVVDLPLGSDIGWGSTIVEDGAHTYVYGTAATADNQKFAHVARVPAGQLGGAWQFWTGSAWSATESEAARVLSGVGTNFGVQKVGAQYVLVTQENNLVFDPQYLAYTAATPTGPFNAPMVLFSAPEQQPGKPIITYDARLHPALARNGKLLVSYNVNSLSNDDNFTDARLYRPRFVEVDWPRPAPDPATLPAAPGGFTATVDASGIARLSWQAVAGATGYRVHRRDVTAAQTHFARLTAPVTGTSTEVGQMVSGHTYEFRVTAQNGNGEGQPTATASVVPRISAPPAPTGVSATTDAGGRATLRWSPVPAAWNYEVHRRDVTAGDPGFTFVTRLGPDVTSHVMEWLEHEHAYEFSVTAHHGGGASEPSALATATAVYTLPGAPTGVTAVANSDGTIKVSWTAPGPNVWYWVYQRDVTAGEEEFTQLSLPITNGTTMTAGFLAHAHTYEFKVAATNRAGTGPGSGVARATSGYPAPAAPTQLTAVAGDGEVKLTWSANPAEDIWYLVSQRDVTAGETSFETLPLPISECCTMTAGLLSNGHTYEFKVAATSHGRDSVASNVVRVTPQIPLPRTPTGLTAAAQSNGTVKLSWTEAEPNLWFDVYQRDVTAGQSFTKLQYPVTSCCTFNAALLTHEHVYEFKIAATNAAGAGPQSTVVRATARYSAPAAPTGLRGTAAGNATINLDWDAPAAGGFYYWVYSRDVTAGQTAFVKGQFPTDRTEASLGLLVHNHVYEYKVAASNAGGEGPASSTIRVTAKGGLPAAPGGLTATPSNGRVDLKWNASATPGVLYNIWRRDVDLKESWQKMELPANRTELPVYPLTNGHTFQFKITAVNSAGDSAFSNVATARPMPPVPAAPTGVNAAPGDGQVTLSWTRSATPNVFYWIEMRPVGGNWKRLQYPVSDCCSLPVKLLRNGTTYEFRMFANNLSGDSPASNTDTARPMPPFPQPASNLTATAGDGKVTLKWAASSTRGVAYYIEMRTRGAANWRRLPHAVGCCTHTVSLLTNGTSYDFRILATNLSGTAAPTNTAGARPMPPFPRAPFLEFASGSPGMVTLDWTRSSTPGVWYWIYYRNASYAQDDWSKAPYPTSNLNVTLSDMFALGDAYEFQVAAYNVAGEARSNIVMEVPRRYRPSSTVKRKGNEHNGSNNLAIGWALSLSQSCQPDTYQMVCFGPPPNLKGQPMTVGDFLFYEGTPQDLEDEIAAEAENRAYLYRKYTGGTAAVRGPNLLRHEEVHSRQWADHMFWYVFAARYGVASQESIDKTGDPACANRWEVDANLYWGRYQILDWDGRRGSCD